MLRMAVGDPNPGDALPHKPENLYSDLTSEQDRPKDVPILSVVKQPYRQQADAGGWI